MIRPGLLPSPHPCSTLSLLGSSLQVTSCSSCSRLVLEVHAPASPVLGLVDCTSSLVHPCFYSKPRILVLYQAGSVTLGPCRQPYPHIFARSDLEHSKSWNPFGPDLLPCPSPYPLHPLPSSIRTPQNPTLFSPTTPFMRSFLSISSPHT